MEDIVPMFPLKIVVFPGEMLNLHIFEPRYKQLIAECSERNENFIMPVFQDDKIEQVATEVKLLEIEKYYDNGEMDIRTQGLRIVEVIKYYPNFPNRLFPGGEIAEIDNQYESDILLRQSVLDMTRKVFGLLSIKKLLPESPIDLISYQIAHNIGLSLDQEYTLLCITNETERLELMEEHLIKIIPVIEEIEHIRQKAALNGHFRHIVPPTI